MKTIEYKNIVEYELLSRCPHTHTLDKVNMFKINQAVKDTVIRELAKGYDVKTVTTNFISKGQGRCYKELVAAGSKYLKQSMV